MTARHVIVLDLGSSALRAHVVPTDQPWESISIARRPYPTNRRGNELGQSFTPTTLRARMLDAMCDALRQADVSPSDVGAIAVAAQRGGTALLDNAGRTLYVGPNRDLRAVFEGAAMDESFGAEIHARTGHLPSMFFPAAKLEWWRGNRPAEAKRIAKVLTLGAWAVHALTGETAESGPSLSEAGLLDIAGASSPPRDLLERLGFDPALLPQIVPPGKPVGVIGKGVAQETDLPTNAPVYLAGPDAQCALLGMGVTQAGETGVVAGWSAPVQRVTPTPVIDSARRAWTGLHVVPERWTLEANPSDTGGTLEAVRRLLRLSRERFDALMSRAMEAPGLAFAMLGPRALDLSSLGMTTGGLLLPVPATQEGLDAGRIALAALENVAYAVRECIELLDSIAGRDDGRPIALTGGLAANGPFPQLLVSVVGKPVRLHASNATATGAAIMASQRVSDWPSKAKEAARRGQVLTPDQSLVLEQADRYGRWLRLRERLDALTDEM